MATAASPRPAAVATPQSSVVRRAAATVIAVGVIVLVTCDLAISGFREWWDGHSFTTDVVSSLLVLAVAGVIVDEVVARRQRKQRSVSVAVQSLILFQQARRTYEQVSNIGDDRAHIGDVRDETTNLANMLLIASPALFDDPQARVLLEQVQRLAGWMFVALSPPERLPKGFEPLDEAGAEMARLRQSVRLLAARIPAPHAVFFASPEEQTAAAAAGPVA